MCEGNKVSSNRPPVDAYRAKCQCDRIVGWKASNSITSELKPDSDRDTLTLGLISNSRWTKKYFLHYIGCYHREAIQDRYFYVIFIFDVF